jgi:Fe2+ or Zn2+ uptake regulation protein
LLQVETNWAAGRKETSVQNDEADVARVRTAILDYLAQHASAADTQEGITHWWLPVDQRTTNRTVIERALDTLVADGLLEGTRLIDGTVLYRRAGALLLQRE